MHYMYSAMKTTPITSNDVNSYMGKPSADEIQEITNLLFGNGQFHTVYDKLLEMLKSNRWNITNMVQHLLPVVLKQKLSISNKHYLIEKLSEIEYRVRNSRDSEIQLAFLVSCFIMIR